MRVDCIPALVERLSTLLWYDDMRGDTLEGGRELSTAYYTSTHMCQVDGVIVRKSAETRKISPRSVIVIALGGRFGRRKSSTVQGGTRFEVPYVLCPPLGSTTREKYHYTHATPCMAVRYRMPKHVRVHRTKQSFPRWWSKAPQTNDQTTVRHIFAQARLADKTFRFMPRCPKLHPWHPCPAASKPGMWLHARWRCEVWRRRDTGQCVRETSGTGAARTEWPWSQLHKLKARPLKWTLPPPRDHEMTAQLVSWQCATDEVQQGAWWKCTNMEFSHWSLCSVADDCNRRYVRALCRVADL